MGYREFSLSRLAGRLLCWIGRGRPRVMALLEWWQIQVALINPASAGRGGARCAGGGGAVNDKTRVCPRCGAVLGRDWRDGPTEAEKLARACNVADELAAEVERLRARLDRAESDRGLLAHVIRGYIQGKDGIDDMVEAYRSLPGEVRDEIEAGEEPGEAAG